FEVRDEHGILRALPFEVGGRHQAALKFLEAPARAGEFRIGRLRAGGYENAVETSLPGVAVQFTREIIRDFPRGDKDFVYAFIAKIHNAFAGANGRDGVGLARLRRPNLERAEVRAMARRPFL